MHKGPLVIPVELFVFHLRMLVTFECLLDIVFEQLAKEALSPIGVIPCQFLNIIMLIFEKLSMCKNSSCGNINTKQQ